MKYILLIIILITSVFGKQDFDNNKYQNEVYLRSFDVVLKENNQKTVWTLVLNKGTSYRFRLFEEIDGEVEKEKIVPQKDISLQLYDAYNPENDKPYGIANSKNLYTFDFNCPETAIYYVSISYGDSCAIEKINMIGMLYFIGKTK